MKKYLAVLFWVLFHHHAFSQEISIMTYNIRLDVASDGENAWLNRKEKMVSQIKFYAPHIFGIQEGMPHQVKFIDEQLLDFNFIGQGRDGENKGEYAAIYYNKNLFKVINNGTFWLSEKPSVVSKGWDAAYPRVCTYGLFVNKSTGDKCFVFNTHLDHMGEVARRKGLELILKKINKLNTENLPVILMGDFNLEPQSEAISILKKQMNDSHEISLDKPFGSVGTFNGFDFESVATRRIDYIFVSNSEKIEVQKYGVINNSYNLKYPSDHFPVLVHLLIKQ